MAAASIVATLLASAALAAPSNKPYQSRHRPDSVAAGSHRTYTVTISNDANQPVLGSANWTIDPGFSDIGNVTLPAGATLEGGVGSTLKLRNLGIAAQTSKSFTYDATAPCTPAPTAGMRSTPSSRMTTRAPATTSS